MKKVLAILLFLCVTFTLVNCTKLDQQLESLDKSPEEILNLENEDILVDVASAELLENIFTSNTFSEFSSDNPSLCEVMLTDSAKMISYYDEGLGVDRVIISLPLNITGDTSFLFIATNKASFDSGNYNNLIIGYQKSLGYQTNSTGVPYGSLETQIYGYQMTYTIIEDSNLVITHSDIDTTAQLNYMLRESLVKPSAECVNTSLENLDASCTGWCKVLRRGADAFFGVWTFADISSAIIYCSTHNNSPMTP